MRLAYGKFYKTEKFYLLLYSHIPPHLVVAGQLHEQAHASTRDTERLVRISSAGGLSATDAGLAAGTAATAGLAASAVVADDRLATAATPATATAAVSARRATAARAAAATPATGAATTAAAASSTAATEAAGTAAVAAAIATGAAATTAAARAATARAAAEGAGRRDRYTTKEHGEPSFEPMQNCSPLIVTWFAASVPFLVLEPGENNCWVKIAVEDKFGYIINRKWLELMEWAQ